MPPTCSSLDPDQVIKAAQYIRMSTENQKYSLQNQMDAIGDYASAHSIEIVRTFADAAKSGLDLVGRPALAKLLEEAQSGVADFELILVYDVSRGGRFLDTDEGAHYEYLCKAAGISITYCAEQFEGQGFSSSVLKLLKRAMAAEYSRELSVKTFAGQCSLIRSGFRTGRTPRTAFDGCSLMRIALQRASSLTDNTKTSRVRESFSSQAQLAKWRPCGAYSTFLSQNVGRSPQLQRF
jgi:DNA invertase Pin-like site-specific DNA recombinase